MAKTVNVLALHKQESRYMFMFQDRDLPKLLQTLGRYAADPELDFTWHDAAVLANKARKLVDNQL